MKGDKRNIEEFLKEKLDGLDAGYQNDWSQFEAKLDRAILFYRMKVGALIGVALILITLGIAGGNGLLNPSNAQESASNQSSILYKLRSRAPVLHALRMRNRPVESIEGSNQLPSSKLSIQPNNEPASQSTLLVDPKDEARPLHHTSDTQPSEKLHLEARAITESLLASIVPAEPQLTFRTPKYITGTLKPSNDANSTEALLLAGENDFSTLNQSFPEQLPVTINSLDHDDFQEFIKASDNRNSDLTLRDPLMPLTFQKRGPYVSPMQAENPWSYSVSVYPNFTFRKFKVDKEKLNLIHRDFIDATQEAEKGGFSLNVGFVVSRRIGRITYLNGGLEYINYKANAEYNFYNYREANINPITNRIESYSLLDEPEQISFSGNNVYHYLNFPLSISHQPWATDHIRLNIEAGGSFMYFLGARGQAIDYQSLGVIDIAERKYNNSIASLHMKVGLCYYISDKLNFGLEPTMMYFTNTIYSEDYPFQVIPYSVGVNLKLQVKLN